MPSLAYCCLCVTGSRLETKSIRYKINSPSIRPAFLSFISDHNQFNFEKDVICCKHRMMVLKPYRVREGGRWKYISTANEGSSDGTLPSQDTPNEVQMYDSTENSTSFQSFILPSQSYDSLDMGEGQEVLPHSYSSTSQDQSVPSEPLQMDSQSSYASTTYLLSRIDSVVATQAHCFLCSSKKDRSVVPRALVRQVWKALAVHLPRTNRCCKVHLSRKGTVDSEDLEKINKIKTGVEMSPGAFADWIHTITDTSFDSQKPHFSFEEDRIVASDYKMLTGLNKEQFDEMFGFVKDALRVSCNRTPRTALGMLLIILRKNLTQDIVGFMFGTTQPVVSTSIEAVKQALLESFVPKYLGIYHITRDEAKQHSVPFFNEVFEKDMDKVGYIADATYFDIEKPADHEPQKMTFSQHRHRNLVKCMLVVLGNAYILEASGPYFANGGSNDATIMKYMLTGTDFQHFPDEEDFFAVDRGFRDVEGMIRENKWDFFMPSLLKKGKIQFTAEESGSSRKVTACRWVVEAVNGRLKNVFKFFGAVIEAGYEPQKIMDFCRIACAMLNKFYPPIWKESPRHHGLAKKMIEKATERNTLAEEIETKEISHRQPSHWTPIDDSCLPEFPRLSMEELISFTMGVYQLREGEKHIRQQLKESKYFMWVHKEEPELLRAKITSRFRSQSAHQVYIKLNPQLEGLDGIIGHVCDCKTGMRVAGCCSHVAAIIRYLSYERYIPEDERPKRTKKWDAVIDARAELENLEVNSDE